MKKQIANKYLESVPTEEDQKQVVLDAIRKKCKISLFYLAKRVLGYKDITNYTHGSIVKCLESQSSKKIIIAPRGSFKSSLAVVAYSIWRLINNPNLRIMIDSETFSNSKNFIREIKAHFMSPVMMDLFGDSVGPEWAEGSITIKQRTKPLKESSITASGIGVTKVGQHYDVIIHDDMNSNNNSSTTDACKKIIDHYKLNVAILDPGGTLIIAATRYSMLDLCGHIMANEIGSEDEKTV